jgi:hypothetical protein
MEGVIKGRSLSRRACPQSSATERTVMIITPAIETYPQKADAPVAITPIGYSGLHEAFDHFNAALCAGELPDVS